MSLLTDYQAKRAELDALFEKAHKNEASADEKAKIPALIEEAEGLATLLSAEDRAAKLREFERTPQNAVPTGSAKVAGFTPAGGAEIQKDTATGGLNIVNEFGEAIIPDEQWQAINSDEYKSAFRTYMRKGFSGLRTSEVKVLEEGSDIAGGFLVPADLLNRLIERKPTPQRVAGRVTSITTSRDRINAPKVNYAGSDNYSTGIRTTWTGEKPASASVHRVEEPEFGVVGISVHTAMMSLPLTNDLTEDAMFPLQQWVSEKFGETTMLLRDDIIMNGSGVGRPAGILANPGGANTPAIVASGAASELTADGLIDLAFSLPEQYDEQTAFYFNKTSTARAIAKLKDGEGRYLWGSGMQDSGLMVPALRDRTLLGYPCVLTGFMPDVDTNSYPIVFGDLRGYWLVERIGFSVQVLRELYAETNQIVVLGRLRLGGAVVEDWRMKLHKVAAS